MVANTMIVITTASTSGPLLSLREGIAVLHNWVAKPKVSDLGISDSVLGKLQMILEISRSFIGSPTWSSGGNCAKSQGFKEN